MGLDAVVYRSRTHLELGPDHKLAGVVPRTGEVFFENEEFSRKYHHQLRAVEHRLGNLAEISALREETKRIIGEESYLFRKILYSETHSGDVIHLSNLEQLSAELDSIRKTGRESTQLKCFMASLEDLVETAKYEGNPIVFV